MLMLSGSPALAAVIDACTPAEHWDLPRSDLSREWMKDFMRFTSGKEPPMTGLARSIRLGRIADLMKDGEQERGFSEYGISRALYDLGLPALAHRGFRSVFEHAVHPDLKRASWICLARIHGVLPDLPVPAWSPEHRVSGPEPAFTRSEADAIVPVLIGRKSGIETLLPPSHQAFLRGLEALQEKRFEQSTAFLRDFLKHLALHPGTPLDSWRDEAWLSLGRALYPAGRFKEAANAFQQVRKTSNLEIEALGNLAWAYLAEKDYEGALGIGIQLRSGGLRRAFAPEPLMVSAMALHELCRYPDSVRMIAALVKDYEDSRAWLETHPHITDRYALTLAALKGSRDLPSKIASEWIRSPKFQRRQLELNELARIPPRITAITEAENARYRKMIRSALQDANELAQNLRALKKGSSPAPLLARYRELKRTRRNIDAFRTALHEFAALSQAHLASLAPLQSRIIDRVNTDLRALSRALLANLDSVRRNADLIEVEILNGASRDLVWNSVHPDFKEESLPEKSPATARNPAASWSWGRLRHSELERAELWEDELGALKADAGSLCEKFTHTEEKTR